jgi:hypothetical protein
MFNLSLLNLLSTKPMDSIQIDTFFGKKCSIVRFVFVQTDRFLFILTFGCNYAQLRSASA